MQCSKGRQLASNRPHVACHSVFSGPRKHSWNIFKSELSFNYHSKC